MGLTCVTEALPVCGLFEGLISASVENVVLQGGIVDFGSSQYAGSIAGIATGDSCSIINCKSDITFRAKKHSDYIGGILGYNVSPSVIISDCIFSGVIKDEEESRFFSEYIGGIVGTSDENIEIRNCSNYGSLSGQAVAGICCTGGTIESCIVNAQLTATKEAASGICVTATGKIKNCSVKGHLNAGTAFAFAAGASNVKACSFDGTSSVDLTYLSIPMTACWIRCNGVGQISTDLDDPSWAENWVVVKGMNNNLPMQKELFWVGSDIITPTEKFKEALDGFKEPDAAA